MMDVSTAVMPASQRIAPMIIAIIEKILSASLVMPTEPYPIVVHV